MRRIKRMGLFTMCVLLGALVVTFSVPLCPTPAAADLTSNVRNWITQRMIFEYNVRIPMRDGLDLAANVYRPTAPGQYPVIMQFTCHGKDLTWLDKLPSGYFLPDMPSAFVPEVTLQPDLILAPTFEAEEQTFWVPHGYVVIVVDPRGWGNSPGTYLPPGFSTLDDARAENATVAQALWARDQYDAIQWAAAQPWSNGNVGLSGVSCLAFSQWRIAEMAPPALKCFVPWSGFTDAQRDWDSPGGIPLNYTPVTFPPPPHNPAWTFTGTEQLPTPMFETPKQFLSKTTIPVLIGAPWSAQFVHTLGAYRAFRYIGSKEKWIRSSGHEQYNDWEDADGRGFRLRFFDHYLKGIDDTILSVPPVRLEVQDTDYLRYVRYENEFPLARTQYKNLYLNATNGSMSFHQATGGKITYDSNTGRAVFVHKFEEDTELTGYMNLELWVSHDQGKEMDILVTGTKLDVNGNPVANLAPTVGAMRVSLRELDQDLSTPWDPVQKGVCLASVDSTCSGVPLPVPTNTIIPINIEVWPNSWLFHKGEMLRVAIVGNAKMDVDHILSALFLTNNVGNHTIYTGGRYDSNLLIPVIPPKRGHEHRRDSDHD